METKTHREWSLCVCAHELGYWDLHCALQVVMAAEVLALGARGGVGRLGGCALGAVMDVPHAIGCAIGGGRIEGGRWPGGRSHSCGGRKASDRGSAGDSRRH